VLPVDDLVKIVFRFYTDDEVDVALLSTLLSINLVKYFIESKRLSKHKGSDKKFKNVQGICKLLFDITSSNVQEGMLIQLSKIPALYLSLLPTLKLFG